ncbi:MAG: hypothetical protein M3371_02745 [Acidobacteriota bacterium]|nr:hypothetical protein [Acidobacteriota bacterium]
MRRLKIFPAGALVFALAAGVIVPAQELYTNKQLEYALELPNPTWRVVTRPDSAHQHTEFVYGDRSDGLLRIRKEVVDAGVTPSELARRDHDLKLRFKPGYIEGKEENFLGRLKGIISAYEYTGGGKPMVARIYYLQADNRTIYVLHFEGARDKLLRIRNQTDAMARSFHLK